MCHDDCTRTNSRSRKHTPSRSRKHAHTNTAPSRITHEITRTHTQIFLSEIKHCRHSARALAENKQFNNGQFYRAKNLAFTSCESGEARHEVGPMLSVNLSTYIHANADDPGIFDDTPTRAGRANYDTLLSLKFNITVNIRDQIIDSSCEAV